MPAHPFLVGQPHVITMCLADFSLQTFLQEKQDNSMAESVSRSGALRASWDGWGRPSCFPVISFPCWLFLCVDCPTVGHPCTPFCWALLTSSVTEHSAGGSDIIPAGHQWLLESNMQLINLTVPRISLSLTFCSARFKLSGSQSGMHHFCHLTPNKNEEIRSTWIFGT